MQTPRNNPPGKRWDLFLFDLYTDLQALSEEVAFAASQPSPPELQATLLKLCEQIDEAMALVHRLEAIAERKPEKPAVKSLPGQMPLF